MNYTPRNEDHTVFFSFNSKGNLTILIVYADDVIITGDDAEGIKKLNQNLSKHFDIKDLGKLR